MTTPDKTRTAVLAVLARHGLLWNQRHPRHDPERGWVDPCALSPNEVRDFAADIEKADL